MIILSLGVVVVAGLILSLKKPSNDRLWKEVQARIANIAKITLEGNMAHVENVRSIRFEKLRETYGIRVKAEKFKDDMDFSRRIRE
jgi:hypothetical protein